MTWRPCDRPYAYLGYVYREDWHRQECVRAARDGKVPAWTAEDETALRRRVLRVAAKAQP